MGKAASEVSETSAIKQTEDEKDQPESSSKQHVQEEETKTEDVRKEDLNGDEVQKPEIEAETTEIKIIEETTKSKIALSPSEVKDDAKQVSSLDGHQERSDPNEKPRGKKKKS